MDTKQLIKDSNARFNIISQKSQLKEKYTSKLIFADQGGLWKSSIELLSYLSNSTEEKIVLLDNYQNPIKVIRKDLLDKASTLYTAVMEEWYVEFNKVQNNR